MYSMWDLKKVHDMQPKLLKGTAKAPKTVPANELLTALKSVRQRLITHTVKECRCVPGPSPVGRPPEGGRGATVSWTQNWAIHQKECWCWCWCWC